MKKKNAELKNQIAELRKDAKTKTTKKRRIIASDPESSEDDDGMEMDPPT